jgi:hypothetical protein
MPSLFLCGGLLASGNGLLEATSVPEAVRFCRKLISRLANAAHHHNVTVAGSIEALMSAIRRTSRGVSFVGAWESNSSSPQGPVRRSE